MACAARRGSANRKAKLSPPTRKICAPLFQPASRSRQHPKNGIGAGIAQAGMNGLEAVHVQQHQQRLVEADAQRIQRLHQRHAIAQPGQGIRGLALCWRCASA